GTGDQSPARFALRSLRQAGRRPLSGNRRRSVQGRVSLEANRRSSCAAKCRECCFDLRIACDFATIKLRDSLVNGAQFFVSWVIFPAAPSLDLARGLFQFLDVFLRPRSNALEELLC